MKKYESLLSENVQFFGVKFSIYLNRHVFVIRVGAVSRTTRGARAVGCRWRGVEA